MIVYRYVASTRGREDYTESGTVVANNETEARRKLEQWDFDHISLKRLEGFEAFWAKFRPDVK